MSLYWFILFLILIFIELITVNLVSIWFALGAIGAMICACFTSFLWVQVVVFLIVSIISLIATKSFVKKVRKGAVVPTNLDRVIGKVGIVMKKIESDSYGEVKVLGTVWTAVSDQPIEVGEKVVIKKIDGVKLVVLKEEK